MATASLLFGGISNRRTIAVAAQLVSRRRDNVSISFKETFHSGDLVVMNNFSDHEVPAIEAIEAERLFKIATQKYHNSAPKLAEWMEQNLSEGFTVFTRSKTHRNRLRTSNMIERLNIEILRQTGIAMLFPNEGLLLRLVSVVLVEVNEGWQTGKCYLTQTESAITFPAV